MTNMRREGFSSFSGSHKSAMQLLHLKNFAENNVDLTEFGLLEEIKEIFI